MSPNQLGSTTTDSNVPSPSVHANSNLLPCRWGKNTANGFPDTLLSVVHDLPQVEHKWRDVEQRELGQPSRWAKEQCGHLMYAKWKVSSLSLNKSIKLSLNKDQFNCSLTNKVTTQTTNYQTSCSVLSITTQALYIGLYTVEPIVQWYYALQHYSVASRSTAYSILVLWQLPVALHIVCWVLLTVVQLPCSNVLQLYLCQQFLWAWYYLILTPNVH